jgi:glycosyl-4,4'-diaponeurosporenoate acyltransferase
MAFVRLWHPDDVAAVIIDIAVIATWSALVGYVFHRMPARWFGHDNALTKPRRWERDGRVWDDVLRVRRWKDRVPDAGGLFAGGMRKRDVTHDPEQLARLVVETRRAELVHLAVLAISPVFLLWNPLWLAAVMVTYNIVANVPFMVIQRYNRPRLVRLLASTSRRSTR